MSFVLPRNPRLIDWSEEPAPRASQRIRALGRERPKHEPPPPPSTKPRGPDVYDVEMIPTPCVGSQSPFRAAYPSYDDGVETQALDRDDLFAPQPPKAPRHGLPVPNFRHSSEPPGPQVVYMPAAEPAKRSGSPAFALLLWVVVAMIAGMAAYRFAPEAVEHVEDAVKTLEN